MPSIECITVDGCLNNIAPEIVLQQLFDYHDGCWNFRNSAFIHVGWDTRYFISQQQYDKINKSYHFPDMIVGWNKGNSVSGSMYVDRYFLNKYKYRVGRSGCWPYDIYVQLDFIQYDGQPDNTPQLATPARIVDFFHYIRDTGIKCKRGV